MDGGPSAFRFNLVPFAKIPLSTASHYLVKGIIPREGLVVVWGPPKCGKSFFVFDLLMHVALGWEYRGRRVKQGPVVYVACEGERGLGARAEAFRQAYLSEDDQNAPFHLVTTRLDLAADAKKLAADIRAQIGDTPPAAIAIDTLNRSITGSESSDEDMSAYVKGADLLREAFKCTVVVIHHCGIDDRRPRGHTSLTGATDALIAVRQDAGGTITATIEMMKDGASGETVNSRLRVVTVGRDEDDEEITSCVVEPSDKPATTRPEPLTPNQRTMFSILHEAGPAGLTVEEWNSRAREAGLGVKRKADLRDFRMSLKAKSLVRDCGTVWVAAR